MTTDSFQRSAASLERRAVELPAPFQIRDDDADMIDEAATMVLQLLTP